MQADFAISVSLPFNLVRIRMGGFFLPADIERFCAERNAAHRRLRCAPNEHITLVDIRDMAIQSQDVVSQFAKVMHTPEVYSRRLAIVVGASLARTQIKRAAEGRDVAYFDSVEAAERWLFTTNADAA